MNTEEFIAKLKSKLRSFSKQEVKERISFYLEMIDDRIEEGLTEKEAIASIGSIDEIASQIASECSEEESVTEKRKLTAWETALLIIGSPIWLPLLLAAFIIIGAVYICVWAVIIVFWAVEAPFFIFALLSRYIFIFCANATTYTALFTKNSFNWFLRLFKGGNEDL